MHFTYSEITFNLNITFISKKLSNFENKLLAQ